MTYLVMECRPGYAVVLDSQGRFLKVVNRDYELGQTVEDVIVFEEPVSRLPGLQLSVSRRAWIYAAAAAACMCLVLGGSYRLFMMPYGTVRMQINPDVMISANRFRQVVDLEGLNEDGDELVVSYSYKKKNLTQVSDELADKALEKGYLKEDGRISVTVDSGHERWREETEQMLVDGIAMHLDGRAGVEVTAGEVNRHTEPEKAKPRQQPRPEPQPQTEPAETEVVAPGPAASTETAGVPATAPVPPVKAVPETTVPATAAHVAPRPAADDRDDDDRDDGEDDWDDGEDGQDDGEDDRDDGDDSRDDGDDGDDSRDDGEAGWDDGEVGRDDGEAGWDDGRDDSDNDRDDGDDSQDDSDGQDDGNGQGDEYGQDNAGQDDGDNSDGNGDSDGDD